MWDNLVIFKERLENEDLFLSQEIYIFSKNLHIFWDTAMSQLLFQIPIISKTFGWEGFCLDGDTWGCQLIIVCRKTQEAFFPFQNFWLQLHPLKPSSDSSTHSKLLPNSIRRPISISGLCSGVSYQIKLVPNANKSKLAVHTDLFGAALGQLIEWLNVSCTVNLINNSNFYYAQMQGKQGPEELSDSPRWEGCN